MFGKLRARFVRGDDGTVSVDFVVLVSALTVVAFGVAGVMSDGFRPLVRQIQLNFGDMTLLSSITPSDPMAYRPHDPVFYSNFNHGLEQLDDAQILTLEAAFNTMAEDMGPVSLRSPEYAMMLDIQTALQSVFETRGLDRSGITEFAAEDLAEINSQLGWDAGEFVAVNPPA